MKQWRLVNKKAIALWRRNRYLKHKDEEAETHRQWIRKNNLYTIWLDMKSRCYNPKSISYKYYGAKGVIVCEAWHYFPYFKEDMGIRPKGCSLDRINPYGNYEPDNCRWATALEQRHNRRKYD